MCVFVYSVKPPYIGVKIKRTSNSYDISSFFNIFKIDKCLRTYEKLSLKYVNTTEIITKVYDDPFFK